MSPLPLTPKFLPLLSDAAWQYFTSAVFLPTGNITFAGHGSSHRIPLPSTDFQHLQPEPPSVNWSHPVPKPGWDF